MKLSQHKIVTSSLFRAHILQVIESTKLLIGQFRSKKAIQDAFFDLSNERFDLLLIKVLFFPIIEMYLIR